MYELLDEIDYLILNPLSIVNYCIPIWIATKFLYILQHVWLYSRPVYLADERRHLKRIYHIPLSPAMFITTRCLAVSLV